VCGARECDRTSGAASPWPGDCARRAPRGPSLRILLLLALILGAAPLGAASRASASETLADIGYQGPSFSGTQTPTGTKRAESVAWWNDGFWWAHMWHAASGDFHIFRLDPTTQAWSDTGVATDTRSNTHADVLWDGSRLYVASHKFVPDEEPAVVGSASYLYRFRYDAGAKRYALDSGFPATINNYATETLVIAKDSTGKLWATWQQDNRIYVNATSGDDRLWGVPFTLPVEGATVTVDDISSVVAFGGRSIGVMWSNQSLAAAGVYFAVHLDGKPATAWEPSQVAASGRGFADDHINLMSDSSGRVLAAVKASFTMPTQPLALLLARNPATGDWTKYPVATVAECPTRPRLVLDEENRGLHVYYTAPAPPTYSCTPSGGAIYKKSSSLDTIAFPAGPGTPVILDGDSAGVNDVSSTKQSVTSRTGITVLAVNEATKRYWHQYEAARPASPPPAAPPAAPPPAPPGPASVAPPRGHCTVIGTDNADVLTGSSGPDVICARGGNDRVYGGKGNDLVYGGAGNDRLLDGRGDDRLLGEGGRDLLFGGAGRDRLFGGAGRDRLLGGHAVDTLTGGGGRDTLVGGIGRDRMIGSAGNDTFHARDRLRDQVRGGPGTDRARADRIDGVSRVERRF
jgi:hypothetical protein